MQETKTPQMPFEVAKLRFLHSLDHTIQNNALVLELELESPSKPKTKVVTPVDRVVVATITDLQ